MEKIEVEIEGKSDSYNILVGTSIMPELISYIKTNHAKRRIALITDDLVSKLHVDITSLFNELKPLFIVIPSGELSKSRETKKKIEDQLIENKFGRDTLIVAVGGGVIGDLAAFTASTFNRGIPIIHIPTTLLAIVDSSIGGKTSVNTNHGKNLIGTIHQPDAVFADLKFLETLPDEEFRNGLFEIIKIAITNDLALFDFIDKNIDEILSRDKDALQHIILCAIQLKKNIIENDPLESGLRQILNFGHTFGHALETFYDYKIKHGYAVAQGILVESKLSMLLGNLKENDEARIRRLIKSIGLQAIEDLNFDIAKIIDLMATDKKSLNQKPRFVLIESIAKVKSKDGIFSFEADDKTIAQAINLCKND